MVWVRVGLSVATVSLLFLVPILRVNGEHASQRGGSCQASSSVQDCRVRIALQGKDKKVRIDFDLETGKGQVTDLTSGKVIPIDISEGTVGKRGIPQGDRPCPGSRGIGPRPGKASALFSSRGDIIVDRTPPPPNDILK